MTDNRIGAEPEVRPAETPLESWKEVAAHLHRTVRTVKRWESEEGLPVHRHQHHARATVYAYPSELDAWRARRQPADDEPMTGWMFGRSARAVALAAMLALSVLTAGSSILLIPVTRAAGDGMVVRQMWTGADVDPLVSPSPDGRFVAGTDWETGDLAVRDVATGTKRRLTNKGTWFDSTEYALFTSVSPDSQHIAYAWFTKKLTWELRVVPTEGGESRLVLGRDDIVYLQPAGWTPDGEHILALLQREDRTNQIALVAAADGSVRALKTLDWRSPSRLGISPDGRWVVYDFPPHEDQQERDIFLLAVDASREFALVQHPANDLFPEWCPDSTCVVFASDRTRALGLWVQELADGRAKGSPRMIRPDLGRIYPLGMTARGSYFYSLSTGIEDIHIAAVDLATGHVTEAPEPIGQRYLGNNQAPDWSPDGKFLVYKSTRGLVTAEFGPQTMTIRDMATGQERDLHPALNTIHRPTWSPDSKTLLVQGYDRKGRPGIHAVDVLTARVTTLRWNEPDTYIQWPTWSADGKVIFFFRITQGQSANVTTLVRRELASGKEDILYKVVRPEAANALALSPDGRQLAFQALNQNTGKPTLRTISVEGSDLREISLPIERPEFLPGNGRLQWTPDGSEILFVRGRPHPEKKLESIFELWKVPAAGGQPQKIALDVPRLRSVALHPDGKRIAFLAGELKSEVWVMENFLPSLAASK